MLKRENRKGYELITITWKIHHICDQREYRPKNSWWLFYFYIHVIQKYIKEGESFSHWCENVQLLFDHVSHCQSTASHMQIIKLHLRTQFVVKRTLCIKFITFATSNQSGSKNTSSIDSRNTNNFPSNCLIAITLIYKPRRCANIKNVLSVRKEKKGVGFSAKKNQGGRRQSL